MSATPDFNSDITVVNNDYPITLAIYKDKKFYYDLPNLQEGSGTWEWKDGKIELRAKLPIFDMYIEVYGSDANFTATKIQFKDRFGSETLKMESTNL